MFDGWPDHLGGAELTVTVNGKPLHRDCPRPEAADTTEDIARDIADLDRAIDKLETPGYNDSTPIVVVLDDGTRGAMPTWLAWAAKQSGHVTPEGHELDQYDDLPEEP